ncbi:2'-5' RNA ligase family protein [Bradyrhizobium sp. HKCCYLR20261]|uniref:2'-5' RNA ligase family protein n=1 Tax=unclassified Bradyrhizobium TaxID=2631580 RepID=UPI003EBE466F
MAVALNIRSDDASSAKIEELWDRVAAFEDAPSMRGLRYRPHFTLAVYETPDIDTAVAWQVMREVVRGGGPLKIEFSGLAWFAHPRFVLWAVPESVEDLQQWHAAISAAIDPACCREHYRPGAWTPHCTLGTRIVDARRADAMAFARAFDQPFSVVFDVADCVTFPPVQIVAEHRLV